MFATLVLRSACDEILRPSNLDGATPSKKAHKISPGFEFTANAGDFSVRITHASRAGFISTSRARFFCFLPLLGGSGGLNK